MNLFNSLSQVLYSGVPFDDLIHSTPRRYRRAEITELECWMPGGLAEALAKHGVPLKKSFEIPPIVIPDWSRLAFITEFPRTGTKRFYAWGYKVTQRDPIRHVWIED